MNEPENILTKINRMIEHFKIRPTHIILNTIYITLKNYGYVDIPRIKYSESNIVDKQIINKYCKEIMFLIKSEPENKVGSKKNYSKEIHVFKESCMLPQNVYVSEKTDEEKLDETYIDNDITSISESENSINSDPEEEGYEIYEEDSDQFST